VERDPATVFVEDIGDLREKTVPYDMVNPHPLDGCNCPFDVGQRLYWDMDLSDPDLPPLLVIFKELAEIQSAIYVLKDGEWVKEEDAKPTVASVVVDQNSIFPQHEALYGRDLLARPIDVMISALTPSDRWPVIEVD
jgi:hypothetical protein